MKKTIEIDGKPVEFSTNFAWMIGYKNQFNEDPAQMIMSILQDDAEGIGFIEASRIAWACAYAADSEIPAYDEWITGFDSFPVITIMTELLPPLIESLSSKKKVSTPASKKATTKKTR